MATRFPTERIERSIFLLRGQKVMVDDDLAELYEIPVKVLNQAVKRNRSRFPEDFMFQLTSEESDSLRSHFVTLKPRCFLPQLKSAETRSLWGIVGDCASVAGSVALS